MPRWSCRNFSKGSCNQWMIRTTTRTKSRVCSLSWRIRPLNISQSLTKCMTRIAPSLLKTPSFASKPDSISMSFQKYRAPSAMPANHSSNFICKMSLCCGRSGETLASRTSDTTTGKSAAMSRTAQAIPSTMPLNWQAVCRSRGRCYREGIRQLRPRTSTRVVASMPASGTKTPLGPTDRLVDAGGGTKRI